MFSSTLHSPQERLQQLEARHDALIESGEYTTWTYPYGSLGAFLVLAYLLIPHQKSPILKKSRYLVWSLSVAWAAYSIFYTRAGGAVASFGVGLSNAWSVLWFTVCLVAYDAQDEFCRIEVAEGASGNMKVEKVSAATPKGHTNDTATATSKENGHVDAANESVDQRTLDKPRRIWQYYPGLPFAERLDWVLDLLMNFRGMGWNWRIATLPSPPKAVLEQLKGTETTVSRRFVQRSALSVRSYASAKDLLHSNIVSIVTGYLLVDVLKTMAIHDPYFIGFIDAPAPSYMPNSIQASPILTRVYRLMLALLALRIVLGTIFALAPIFFVGMLGPKRIGVRGEHWMYPAEWGSYMTVFDKGLAGWWGAWWHQTFRFAFETPASRTVELLRLAPRSMPAKVVQLFVVFALSGFLHASGSHTSLGETRPVRGPWTFFLLQPVGIIAQMMLGKWLRAAGVTQRTPKVVRRMVNFVFVHIWMYWTAPLFIDDLAKGGTFLFEPVPVSLVRGLGFGLPGDSWYTWKGGLVIWHTARNWWQSGITT